MRCCATDDVPPTGLLVTASPNAKQIFLDALEHAPPQRRAYVQRICDGDADLAARVLALLACHDDGTGILDTRPLLDVSVLDELSHPMADARIGPYRLVRVLGRGGHGIVWLAEQTEPIRRQVALKLLHPSLTGFGAFPAAARDVVARFEAERQALAGMDHPNVARVIDAGSVRGGPHAGQPFFAMEFVDGPSITEYCDQQAMPIDQRLALFVQVCAGVQHAHQRGLIHRDLKPGNVLVATLDGRATPKVIDFGVAKAIGSINPHATLTQHTTVIGTPQYMSPEQAQPGGVVVDTRSDVYSLGAMLYQLLTGSPPIPADTVRGLRVDEVCRMISDTMPPAPSTRIATYDRRAAVSATRSTTTTRLVTRLRGELDWIVLRALEKEPARRYQSPADLAGDIQRHLRNEPIAASPPGRWYRLRKFVRRHRAGTLMAAALALTLFTATFVSLAQARKARRAEAAAHAQAEQAKHEAAKFMAMARFSQGILRSIDPAIARDRDKTLLREVLDNASKRTQSDPEIAQEVAVPILSTIGYAYAAIGETERALFHYRAAYGCAQQVFGNDHPDTLKEAQNFFAALVETGDYKTAESLVGDIASGFERANLADAEDALSFYSNAGALYFKLERPAQALPLFERAAAGWMRAKGSNHKDSFAAQNNLAAAYFRLDQLDRAREIWERLFDLQTQTLGGDHPQTLSTLNNLGMLAEKMNDPATAETRLRQVLDTKRRVLSPAHPSRLMTEINLGTFYIDQKRYADAVAVLRPGYADSVEKCKPDDPRRMTITLRLAEALRGLGQTDESGSLVSAVRAEATKLPADNPIRGDLKRFAIP